MNIRKGQAELIILVGIIVVFVAVVFYTYQSSLFTAPVTPETENIRNTIENFIREGARDTLRTMYDYGGYLEAQPGSVIFLGKEIPYWQKSGQVSYPDVRQNLVQGVTSYLNENKDSLEAMLAGKNVTLGTAYVSAVILGSQITLTVNMPTQYMEQSLQQPYVVTVPSKLGEIYEFSKGFAAQEATSRYFEYFTVSSMMISPFEGGVQAVPVVVLLTQCGEMVFKTWFDIKPGMEDVIKTTLAHTYMPGKSPLGVMHKTSFPKYMIPEIGNKAYEDLNISFHLPDDFELTQSNFQFTPNPISAFTEPVPMTSQCYSNPVYVKYAVNYPVIVRVKDSLTGDSFHFAIDVSIYDNAPRPWTSDTTGYTPEVQQEICENQLCTASITVTDSSGAPVSGAEASFMGCPIGRTDSNGIVTASIPCGIGPLVIYKNRYQTFEQMMSSDHLEGTTISIEKIPVVNLNFYEVNIVNNTLTDEYWIRVGDVNMIDDITDETIHIIFYDLSTGETYERIYENRQATIRHIPPGSYAVTAMLSSPDMAIMYGAVLTTLTITEDMDGGTLYVYLPYNFEFKDITDSVEKTVASRTLTAVLEECGIGPISSEQYDINNLPCKKAYSEIVI